MASRAPALKATMKRGVVRGGAIIGALFMGLATLLLALALGSYSSADASLNTAAGGPPTNIVGTVGAWVSDIMLSTLGLPILLLFPLLIVATSRLWRGASLAGWGRLLTGTVIGILLISTAFALFRPENFGRLPGGLGGVLGFSIASTTRFFLEMLPFPEFGTMIHYVSIALFGLVGVIIWSRSLGLDADERAWLMARRWSLTGWLPRGDAEAAEPAPFVEDRATPDRPAPRPVADVPAVRRETKIVDPKPAPAPLRKSPQQTSFDLKDRYVLPGLELLTPAPASTKIVLDKAALERNARLLETVLDDFKVKGVITEVRPGPVVTMYELEPESGIKASRVIQLADDIARNMSALSARVATIPGRTVIGIELPNAKREPVVFHELAASAAFADQTAQLPIILGKNIAGDPVIADLAPMPHLLVAGTTGSGKSVGLNSMILSLLYRLTPDQCRMIMIDPKMLELSIYDDIPHLLSPVVTEPAKAIRALKWAVEQMEDRYRMMASISVRSLSSYNEKVRAAHAKGEKLGRRVQTGYDAESGRPIYEEEQLDFRPLPQIVVIVDELADLMMTAGKEVEFLIQRLAQKARAAGIHLIMATQRPSVDVITGVIKANLPTRISFSVTSKIDSRTILGEQGAEQLLGKGDMLYMPGGKQIARVHGPFVSDDEVRLVADHWRAQGAPDYIQAVTEEPEEGGWSIDGAPDGEDSAEDQMFRRSVQVVAESQKASTSYIQRQLRIGYNSAARLIERMESEGIVSRPDHVGRREVLIDRDGNPV